MGGNITVGIRCSDGTEYVADRWTNPLSFYLNHPHFYEEGSAILNEYVLGERDEPSWIGGRQKRIHPSEYGVVLIDFKARELLSRQGYTSPGKILMSPVFAADNSWSEAEVKRLGWVYNTERWSHGMYEVRWKHPTFEFDHDRTPARDCWRFVCAWLRGNQWKTEPVSVGQVRSGRYP